MASTPANNRPDLLAWTDEQNDRLMRLKEEHHDISWKDFHAFNYFPGRSGPAVQVQYSRLKHGRSDGLGRKNRLPWTGTETGSSVSTKRSPDPIDENRAGKRLRSEDEDDASDTGSDGGGPGPDKSEANNGDSDDDDESSGDEGDISHTGEVVKIRERNPVADRKELLSSGVRSEKEHAVSGSPTRSGNGNTLGSRQVPEHATRVTSHRGSSGVSRTPPGRSILGASKSKSPITGAVSTTTAPRAISARKSPKFSQPRPATSPSQQESNPVRDEASASLSAPQTQNEALPGATSSTSLSSSVEGLTKTQCLEGTVRLLARFTQILGEEDEKEAPTSSNGSEETSALRQRIADLESQVAAQKEKIQDLEISSCMRVDALRLQMEEMAERANEMTKRAEKHEQVIKAFTKFTTILNGAHGESVTEPGESREYQWRPTC
ncbi:uncharacterized protein BDV17DRAFT_250563 [Aspergillus undulatus]|uniref:uncharacterized protein n=1 Tax=Aspergillus undulatus TaxID=1810928 RepID=UPI003CCCEB78